MITATIVRLYNYVIIFAAFDDDILNSSIVTNIRTNSSWCNDVLYVFGNAMIKTTHNSNWNEKERTRERERECADEFEVVCSE